MRALALIAAVSIAALVTISVFTDTWLYLLFAIVGAVFVVLAFAYPRLAVMVWLLVAPLADAYGTIHLPGPDITFSRTAIALITVVLLTRMALRGRRLRPFGAVELAMLALVAIMTLDLMTRGENLTSNALQAFDLYVTPILVFFCARNLFVDRVGMKQVGYILAVVGCYLALHGVYQYVAASSPDPTAASSELTVSEGGERTNESHLEGGRAVGPFTNAVEFGSVAAIGFLAALVLALHRSRGAAWTLPALALIPTGVAVILSSTRSVWLGAYLALCSLAIFDRRRRRAIVLAIGAVTVAAVVSVAALSDSSSLKERASSLDPIYARVVMYRVAARLVMNQPFIGYGRGAPSRVAARKELYALGGNEAEWAPGQFHNVFVGLLVEWGVAGVAAYIAMFVLFVRAAVELRRRVKPEDGFAYHFSGFFLAVTVVTVVQGLLVDLPAFLYLNSVYFLLAGLVYAGLDAVSAARADRQNPVIATRVPAPSAPGFAKAMTGSVQSRS